MKRCHLPPPSVFISKDYNNNHNNDHNNEYKKNIITIIFTFEQICRLSSKEYATHTTTHDINRDTGPILFSCTHSCKIICNYEF